MIRLKACKPEGACKESLSANNCTRRTGSNHGTFTSAASKNATGTPMVLPCLSNLTMLKDAIVKMLRDVPSNLFCIEPGMRYILWSTNNLPKNGALASQRPFVASPFSLLPQVHSRNLRQWDALFSKDFQASVVDRFQGLAAI